MGFAEGSQRTHQGPTEDSQRTRRAPTGDSQRIHQGFAEDLSSEAVLTQDLMRFFLHDMHHTRVLRGFVIKPSQIHCFMKDLDKTEQTQCAWHATDLDPFCLKTPTHTTSCRSFAKRPRTKHDFPQPSPTQGGTLCTKRKRRQNTTHEMKTQTERSRSPGSGWPPGFPLTSDQSPLELGVAPNWWTTSRKLIVNKPMQLSNVSRRL